LLLLPAAGCKDPTSRTAKPATDAPETPPAIRVTSDRKDLVFSYRSGDVQDFQTAASIDQIPIDARGAVVVTDLSLTPEERQSGRYIYLADLRSARSDGTFPTAIMSRYGFEAKLSGTSTAGGGGGSGKEVIVYSASWCGVCKSAKHLLKAWGVHFQDKDIEGSRSAAEELAAKAKAAGIQPGGVPVIDVAGVLLQGLDETTLRSVLKEKGFLR
jgi:glutaredoxin